MPKIPIPRQNSSDYRLQELAHTANEHHRQFQGAMLRGIKEHARCAGDALNEAKRQVPHGDWTAWLKVNFRGSPETARVYMDVARNWQKIVKNGWDEEGVTLAQLRQLLASARVSPRPETRQYTVTLSESEVERLKKMLGELQPVLGTDNPNDTLFRAVQTLHGERCHD